MRTTWYVVKMTATETVVTAELVRREWFKKNPEWVAVNDEYDALVKARGEAAASNAFIDREYPEEFIEAEPGEEGADFLDTADTMHFELPDDEEDALSAGDDVVIELTVVAEPADA